MEEQLLQFQNLLKAKNTPEAIDLLKQYPNLIEGKTDQGVSFLLLSAYYQNEPLLNYFLDHKPSLSIFEAAATGNLNRVKSLIENKTSEIDAYSPDGFTSLGLACYFGYEVVAEYLVKNGANVNLASNNGMKVAPLHSAVANKNVRIAHLLLEKGADVNAKQTLGVTPLHSAAHRGDEEMVRLLIKFKADLNAEMENGKKPLDIAKNDQNEVVIALLS